MKYLADIDAVSSLLTRRCLCAAYGVATLLAGLAVLVGLVAILLNGASYSNSFSTVFRVARGAEVNTRIKDDDMDGKDPLPEYLSKSEVRLGKTVHSTKTVEGSPNTPRKRGDIYRV